MRLSPREVTVPAQSGPFVAVFPARMVPFSVVVPPVTAMPPPEEVEYNPVTHAENN
jgi:hypothetical protein